MQIDPKRLWWRYSNTNTIPKLPIHGWEDQTYLLPPPPPPPPLMVVPLNQHHDHHHRRRRHHPLLVQVGQTPQDIRQGQSPTPTAPTNRTQGIQI